MRLYLAGPMRGLPLFNFPAFHAAAKRLRELGHDVWSPAEHDENSGFNPATDEAKPLRFYMRHDLPAVLKSDAVALLPGWRKSQGARLEVHVATECGIPCLDAETLEPISETCLEEAQRLVYGDRAASYGHPLDDYERTSAMVTALLADKLKPGERVTAEDMIRAMCCVKLSRDVHSPKRDNRVDLAGYAECLQRVTDERARRAS